MQLKYKPARRIGLAEIWKDAPGYEQEYAVSNFGRVISFKKGRPKFIQPTLDRNGYFYVTFCPWTRKKRFQVHRLVLLAFVGPSELVTNHKDGNPKNNKLSNLEYCTHSENVYHAYRTGLNTAKNRARDERNGNGKLTKEQAIEIRGLKGKMSQEKIGKLYGVDQTCISCILLFKTHVS